MIQEIHDSGSLMSAAVNATCCALIDAGVPMKCPVVGVQVKESQSNRYDFVFDANLDHISIITNGKIDEDSLDRAISMGREKAQSCLDIIRSVLVNGIKLL